MLFVWTSKSRTSVTELGVFIWIYGSVWSRQCWDLCQTASEEMSSGETKDASAKPGTVWKSSEGDAAPSATKQDFSKVTELNHLRWSTGSSASCQTAEAPARNLELKICLEESCACLSI